MKKIIFIMLLAIIGFGSKTMGQGSCVSAPYLSPTDTIIQLSANDTVAWFMYQANSNYLKITLFSNLMSDAISEQAQLAEVSLYSGNCNNLIKVTDIDSLSPYSFFNNNITNQTTYYIKVKYKSEWNPKLFIRKQYIEYATGECVHNCNLIANGDFNDAIFDDYSHLNPFYDEKVSCWCAAWGSPMGNTFFESNSVPSNTAILGCGDRYWVSSNGTSNGSEGIYQEINIEKNRFYQLTFRYRSQVQNPLADAILHILITNDNFQVNNCLGIPDNSTGYPFNAIPVINNIVWQSSFFISSVIPYTFTENIQTPNFLSSGQYKLLFYMEYIGNVYKEKKYVMIDDVSLIPLDQPTVKILGNFNNCSSTTSYSVENPLPNTNYFWSVTPANAAIIPNIHTPTLNVAWNPIDPNTPATLEVYYYDQNGCKITGSLKVYQCCKNLEYPNRTLNDEDINSTSFVSGLDYFLNGVITVTSDLTIDQNYLRMGPMAKIVVNEPHKLIITSSTSNASIVNAGCNFMWDGIYVSNPNAELNVNNQTEINNAINGIVASDNSKLTLNNANFYYNLTCVNINNYIPQLGVVSIESNNFIGGSLISPYASGLSEYGIKLNNANDITIGDLSNETRNTFNNLLCGIFARDSYTKIYANTFYNIQGNIPGFYRPHPLRLNKPTAIYSCHALSGSIAPKLVEIGGGVLGNYFDNCQNGIGIYNERSLIASNIIKARDYGIYIKDPVSNTQISGNIIGQCSDGIYPLVGMEIKKTLQTFLNLSVKANTVSARSKGIYIGGCKSNRSSELKPAYVDVVDNNIHMYDVNTAKTGILAENCLAIHVKCNFVERMTAALPAESMAMMMHGISLKGTQDALVQENNIKHMGAGINVYGCADLSRFNCNVLDAGFYGFLFNYQATITNQGDERNRTDNQFMPYGHYSANFGGQNVERKFWESNSLLPSGTPQNPPIKWWVYDNSYLLHPENQTLSNPTFYKIIPSLTEPDAESSCSIGCIPVATHQMSIEEREALYGAIVRDELRYPDLEDQYKAYNRYLLYMALSQNNDLINLGGNDDYMYQDFYNNQRNGNIGKFDDLETLIAEGNIDQALVKVNQIQNTSLIEDNQKQANSIYLNTFARDNYNLSNSEYLSLYEIATNTTPWEGGEGVLIARYMLGIDIDMSNPNVQFTKGQGGIKESELLKVFPNPATDNLMLSFDKAIDGGFVIEVYNHTGSKVLSETVSQTQAQYQLNTTKLKNGIYFISVRSNAEIFKSKFTIIK